MTDEPATPPEEQPPRRSRVRLWVTLSVVGAVLALLTVVGVASVAAAWSFDRLAETGDGRARAHDACITLETRLNRLTPPGATTRPVDRAGAIRDENAAVRLFLTEVEQQRGRDHDDWLDSWRALLEARTAYAEALLRQDRVDEPAFFVPPRTNRGGSVVDQTDWRSPEACRGPIRRLAAPDL